MNYAKNDLLFAPLGGSGEIGMNVLDGVSYLYISVPDDTDEDNVAESNELPIIFHPERISIDVVVGTSLSRYSNVNALAVDVFTQYPTSLSISCP